MKVFEIKLQRKLTQTTTRIVTAENRDEAIEKAKHHADEKSHMLGHFGCSLVTKPIWEKINEEVKCYNAVERDFTEEELKLMGLSENGSIQ